MKKLLLFLLLLCGGFSHKAFATCTTPITTGMTSAQIQTAVNSCSSGDTANVPAGTYTITSQIKLPCGVSLSGPVLNYQQTHYQSAIFVYSGISQAIKSTTGCTALSPHQHVSYLEINGNHIVNGGGGVEIVSGSHGFDVIFNWIHGMYSNQNYESFTTAMAGVALTGGGGTISNPTTDVNIEWNEFGSETTAGDCGAAMQASDTEKSQGLCVGILNDTFTNNMHWDYNIFHNIEQGAKVVEATTNGGSTTNSGNTNNFYMQYNNFQYIHRMNFETQGNYYNTTFPTYQTIQYNFSGNRDNTANTDKPGTNGQQNYDFSIANGCGNPPANPKCTALMQFNLDIQDQSYNHGSGNEFWGDSNSLGNYNWMEGYVAAAGGAFHYAKSGQFNFNNNIFNIHSGNLSHTNCQTGPFGGFWNQEDAPAFTPTCTGNSYANTGLGTRTSVAPSFSQVSGAYPSGTVINITNSGTLLDGNTSAWCTVDGTTPVPGSGSAKIYTSITLTGPINIACVGMWGAANQPTSYPSGVGYVPSASVSRAYTISGGGTPTASSPTFTPAAGTYTSAQSVTLATSSSGAIICYNFTGSPATNGGTGCTTGTLYTGAIAVSSTTTVYAVAGGTGYLDSPVTNATYTISSSTPTVLSGYLGNPGSQNTAVAGGPAIQFTAYANYSSGPTPGTLPDSYGNVPIWSVIPGSSTCGTITAYVSPSNPGGLFTPTTAGTCNVSAQCTGCGHINNWTMTISAPVVTLTSITLATTGGVTQLTIGSTNQLIATGHYSDGSTANITSSITSWTSSNNSFATVGSGGLVTGVAVGTPTFTGTYSGITSSPALPIQIISGVTLQSVTISTPGGVNVMQLGWTLPFTATCNFSDGSSTPCRSPVWSSSDTTKGTITLGSDGVTGILKEVGIGTGTISVTQSPVTSSPYSLTYAAKAPITFSLTGAQLTFTGTSITVNYK